MQASATTRAQTPRAKQRQTIYTLAEQAGVSASTVARALRDDPAINCETRRRIRELAERTGFKRSQIAVRLSKGKTGMLAMLVPTSRNPVYASLSEAVINVASETGHEILVGYAENSPGHEAHIIERFRGAHIDGLIIVPEFWQENRGRVLDLCRAVPEMPVVVNANLHDASRLDTVSVDFRPGTHEAVRYLSERGHKTIGYLGSAAKDPRIDRSRYFREAMEQVHRAADPRLIVHCGGDIDDAHDAARKLLADHRPTALIVKADYHSFGVLRAAAECGLNVPADLSIVSFDGIELGAYGSVPITTWAQPVEAIAGALVKSMLARLDGDGSPPYRHRFLTRLIERNSVAPCRAK